MEEELPDHGYPLVTTAVTNVTEKGVHFTGTVQFPHLEDIVDHGFVWGNDKENLSIQSSNFFSLGKINTQEFSALVGSTLERNTTYYGRAFAKTKAKIAYGPAVRFVSLGSEGPILKSFFPTEGGYGDTIRISGKNFNFKKETNVVSFEGVPAIVADAADTLLKVIVPGALVKIKNKIKVAILENGSQSSGTFDVKAPVLRNALRSTFSLCDTLVIQGENLRAFGDKPFISFNNYPGTLISTSSTQIKVRMPWIVTNPITLRVNSNLFESVAPFTVTQIQPSVTSISPLVYAPGDTISVSIADWATCQTMKVIRTNGYQNDNLQIIEAGTSHVKFIAPDVCIPSFKLSLIGETFSVTPDILINRMAPKITSIVPSHGTINDEVLITGEHLPDGQWWSERTNFMTVDHASSTEIRGRVYEVLLMESPTIDVMVTGCGGTTTVANAFTYDAPEIHSIFPRVVTNWDDEITIYGKNFSSYQNRIAIGNFPRAIYVGGTMEADRITFHARDFLRDGQLTENIGGPITITTSANLSVTSQETFVIDYQSIWRSEQDFPGAARSRAVSFTIDGVSYVGMGSVASTGTNFTDWWAFDGSGWTKKADFPVSDYFSGSQACAANGKGYFGLSSSQRLWYEYNPYNDNWIRKADFPGLARDLYLTFSANDKVYVGGGFSANGAMLDLWEYDPLNDQWTQKANSPLFPISGLAFGHQGKGYAFSQSAGAITTLIYDPTSDKWTTQGASSSETNSLRSGPCVIKFDEYAIIQGYDFQSRTFTLHKFNPSTNSFARLFSTYGAIRSTPTGFSMNNRGYFVLGHENTYLKNMFSFDPALLQ